MKLGTTLASLAIFATAALPLTAAAQSREWNDRKDDNRSNSRRNYGNDRSDRNSRNDRNNNWGGRNGWNDRGNSYDHRQDTKNEWRNIAIGAGALGILGLLSKDNTLGFAGLAGTLYSLNRYEQDRKSQNQLDRARARYFDYDHFNRNGVRYDRKVVVRNGQRYYQFVRGR